MGPIGPPRRHEPGVHLTLSIDRDQVTVHHAAYVRHAPRGGLRAPILTPDRAAALASPASEFTLFVLDADGSVLDQFGWPFWMDEFFDHASPRSDGDLIGAPERSSVGIRVWRLPLVEGARFLYIVRSDATQTGRQPGLLFRQQALALYWLGLPPPPPPPLPPLPVPWPSPPQATPLPTFQRLATDFPYVPPPPHLPQGRIVDVEPIVQHGPVETCFNILVVGDGFTESELGAYDQRVRTLVGEPSSGRPDGPALPPSPPFPSTSPVSTPGVDLAHMEPFASVWALINVWSVRTVSSDSGITIPGCAHTDCQQPSDKRTYYRVKGCFRGKPYPGYVGIEETDEARIRNAAALAVPLEYTHLIIVIANYDKYGGSAFPAKRLAFATMGDGTDIAEWVQLVAHECAHAIAHVAEEDIRCVPKDPLASYPNQASLNDVDSNAVWWQDLAQPQELLNGHFRAIHRFGDELSQSTGQPVTVPPDLYRMLGAFWGCQSIDADQAARMACDRYGDSRGQSFFRPMAECRMRKLAYRFCRVCHFTIASRIAEVCV